MTDYFLDLPCTEVTACAPQYFDFKNLAADTHSPNVSAWFDSHESYYADATLIASPIASQKGSKKKTRSGQTATTSSNKSTKRTLASASSTSTTSASSDSVPKQRRTKTKAASLARPALKSILENDAADEVRLKHSKANAANIHSSSRTKRSASLTSAVKPQGKDLPAVLSEDMKENQPLDLLFLQPKAAPAQENCVSHSESEIKSRLFMPKPSSTEDVDQQILRNIEEQRRARQQAKTSLIPALPISAPTLEHQEQEGKVSSDEAASSPEEQEVRPEESVMPRPAQGTKSKRNPQSARAGAIRAVGKHVPGEKRLMQQRTQRLENGIAKQRERAKAQRQKKHERTEMIEQAKKQRAQERQEQDRVKKQTQENREQRHKERERRAAEDRERKLIRIKEKQRRPAVSSKEKQLFSEDFAVRSVKPLTCPKEFHFATEARSRSHKIKEAEQKTQEKPALPRSISHKDVRVSAKALTKPKSFVFSTEARAARKRLLTQAAVQDKNTKPTKRNRLIAPPTEGEHHDE